MTRCHPSPVASHLACARTRNSFLWSSSASHASPSSLLPGSCAPGPPAYFYFLNAQLYCHFKLLLHGLLPLPRAFSPWMLQGRLLLWPQPIGHLLGEPFSFYPNRRNIPFAKSLWHHSLSGKLLLFEIILIYVFSPKWIISCCVKMGPLVMTAFP